MLAGSCKNRPIVVKCLVKNFASHAVRRYKERFVAVDNVSVSYQDKHLFAILGHNGAGKSVSIKCMTGVIQPTKGDVSIYGYSIKESMYKVRKMIGVCPQDDILWDTLTAYEHLKFYALFQGLRLEEMKRSIAWCLEGVALTDVKDKAAGKYSGGMKRRLSLAISAVGRKPVLFLDEPTTGKF